MNSQVNHPLPVALSETLQQCIDTYGKQPQVDMAIEEMSDKGAAQGAPGA